MLKVLQCQSLKNKMCAAWKQPIFLTCHRKNFQQFETKRAGNRTERGVLCAKGLKKRTKIQMPEFHVWCYSKQDNPSHKKTIKP